MIVKVVTEIELNKIMRQLFKLRFRNELRFNAVYVDSLYIKGYGFMNQKVKAHLLETSEFVLMRKLEKHETPNNLTSSYFDRARLHIRDLVEQVAIDVDINPKYIQQERDQIEEFGGRLSRRLKA